MFIKLVCSIARVSDDKLKVTMLGTGFIVDNKNYLIAVPRHIVGDSDKGLCVVPSEINSINDYQDTTNTQVPYVNAKIYAIDNFRDITILKLNEKEVSSMPFFSNSIIGNFDNIDVGEKVDILGYPHCVEGRRVLTYQEATIGAKVILECNSIKSKHAVLNIQARPGQSGSLIYSKRLNQIVGMLVGTYGSNCGILIGGINPGELNQTTHGISAEYINNMIQAEEEL